MIGNRYTVYSNAKVNLFFQILNKFPDGYHNVHTLMQSVNLTDILKFEFYPCQNLTVELNLTNNYGSFPLDNNNLIVKAILAFIDLTKLVFNFKIRISVTKNIPIGAGLGGGSSNCAATLQLLNNIVKNPLSYDKLIILAKELGADVPFNLNGGLQFGHHFGDQLVDISNYFFDYHMVLLKPAKLNIQTAWAYAEFDKYDNDNLAKNIKRNSDYLNALDRNDYQRFYRYLKNSFEKVVFKTYPDLKELYQAVLKLNPDVAHLTGSGSCIYAIFTDKDRVDKFKDAISAKFPDLLMWSVQPVKFGNNIILVD